MKQFRIARFDRAFLTPRAQPCLKSRTPEKRCQSTIAQLSPDANFSNDTDNSNPSVWSSHDGSAPLPSPPIEKSLKSAKLAALHARLGLPASLPLQTLARTLVHPSADPSPSFNNASLSVLGSDLLGYYTAEQLVCRYPRLPMAVISAAMWAYFGAKTSSALAREWGVESAAEPGAEVDPGLLQFTRALPATRVFRENGRSRIIYSDKPDGSRSQPTSAPKQVTLETACTQFVRALAGAVFLHGGRDVAKQFFRDHILTRDLSVSSLFVFKQPTRDLSRLCAREGFDPPVARLISETGRKSRHPVFVVGVYSGQDLLGQAAGSSLNEARIKAAIAALKGWYLYSPIEYGVPSDTEGEGARSWKPAMIDCGEVVV